MSVTYMYIYVYERCGVREKRYVGVGVREIADVKVLCIIKVLQSALCMYVYTYVNVHIEQSMAASAVQVIDNYVTYVRT